MKDFSWKIFAIKTIIFSLWGLSTLPFLSIIVQYIDSITGFSSGNGYHTNHMDYIFESPLVYMGVVLCINIILAIAYLIYCFFKAKREWLLKKNQNKVSGICNQFLNGKTDQKLFCNEMKDRLNDYYGSRYELRNQSEAVEGRVSNMLSKLQHMYAL